MKILDIHEFRTNDNFGSGAFGASRGNHKHEGVDLVANKGDYVYAPFEGKISKHGYCYAGNMHYRYIEVTGESEIVRILYAKLDDAFKIGSEVGEGQFLGMAQGIEDKYPGITPHVHVELYKANDHDRSNPIDPTEFLKKKELF